MARYGQRPENALKRANEFIEVGKPARALDTLYEVFKNKKWAYNWSESVLEPIMFKYLELCVELKKSHIAKEGLFQYRNMFQSVNVGSLENVIRGYLRSAEERTESAREQSQQAVIDIDDLDNLTTPESILLSAVSGEDAQDRSDRTILTPWVKFLWESYCQCLELLRTNAHVETLYHDIAKMAFNFCLKYNRKTEFRKLCDKLRKHLEDIGKLPPQTVNVSLSKPETQQYNLETRLVQLDSAIQMELWQEAYKATEDIHNLMTLSKKSSVPKTMANCFETSQSCSSNYEIVSRLLSLVQIRIDHGAGCIHFGTDLSESQREDKQEGPLLQPMPSEQIRNQLINMSSIRIDHGAGCIHFGTDLSESQREDKQEGPLLQPMPSEQIRNQLINMSSVLTKSLQIINPHHDTKERSALHANLIRIYHNTKASEHMRILARHKIIEDRKEHLEKMNTQREEEEARRQVSEIQGKPAGLEREESQRRLTEAKPDIYRPKVSQTPPAPATTRYEPPRAREPPAPASGPVESAGDRPAPAPGKYVPRAAAAAGGAGPSVRFEEPPTEKPAGKYVPRAALAAAETEEKSDKYQPPVARAEGSGKYVPPVARSGAPPSGESGGKYVPPVRSGAPPSRDGPERYGGRDSGRDYGRDGGRDRDFGRGERDFGRRDRDFGSRDGGSGRDFARGGDRERDFGRGGDRDTRGGDRDTRGGDRDGKADNWRAGGGGGGAGGADNWRRGEEPRKDGGAGDNHGRKILGKLDEADIKNMDADQITARELEELQKERREQQQKLKSQEKKMDYFERAKRLEEIPLIEKAYEEKKVRDRKLWEEREAKRIEQTIEDRNLAVAHRERLKRMKEDKEYFMNKLLKERLSTYEDKLEAFEKRLAEERKKRLAKRKVERKRERRQAWLEAKEAEERKREEEEERKRRDEETKRR
ncbi:eukaryotic translation initiation factor 3 subunit A [Diaphorina citri]|uniref:Eukaryotic translation initiation factor 3 subunit A n=1 Tax=Diaphorina citri TaxID=121845 RepID=A0A1S3D369_DIACI|nr:eukaryotic translation initiation factor 3 subunit A [Diaphorina citri]